MATTPGTYNITLQRRADYSIALQFKDNADSPINLTGWSVAAQAWNVSHTTKYADFTTGYTNRVNGQVTLSLTYTQTASLPAESHYDVLLTNPSGVREYYLEGMIYALEGYTE